MKYEIKESMFDVDLEEKKILLDTDSGKYFELNSTSAEIFNLVKEKPRTLEEVKELIFESYEIKNLDIDPEIVDHLESSIYVKVNN